MEDSVQPATPVKIKPSIYLAEDDFPIVKELETVGQKCHLEVDAKIISVSEDQYDGKKKRRVTVEIQDLYFEPKGEKESSKERVERMTAEHKEKHGK
jgi:hypothetical protein